MAAIPVTFLRPYDTATRERVISLVESAGAKVSKVFLSPLDFWEVGGYLNGPGRDDQLVCPFHAKEGQNGIEVLGELAKLGIVRRVVMPVKFGAPIMVKQRVAREVPAYAGKIFTFTVDDAETHETRAAIATWLAGR
jgi:hypothetical protein